MEQLIIQALKSACGNRNIKFQVIVQAEQLHIYANHRQDYQPSYLTLEENVRGAIASLALTQINSFWLYARPLNQLEPNWQVFRELTTQDNSTIKDTDSNDADLQTDIPTEDLAYLTAEIDAEIELEGVGNFDLLTNGTTGDARLLLDQKNIPPEEIPSFFDPDSLADEVSFSETPSQVSTGDTGLLQNQGLIHGSPLKEAEIGTFFAPQNDPEDATEVVNSASQNKLAQYCLLSDRQLLTTRTSPRMNSGDSALTEKATAPSKEIMRLVKFFHYLAEGDQQQLVPIVESYLEKGLMEAGGESSSAIQNWLTKISALEGKELNTFALWFSRYCLAPTATLEEFKAIATQNAAEMNIRQASRDTEYGFVPVKKDDASLPAIVPAIIESPVHLRKTKVPAGDRWSDSKLDQGKFQLPRIIKQLVKQHILPGIWILVTMILILVGIISHNSPNGATSAEIPALCKNTIGSQEYCRLAVDLAGEKAIAEVPESLFPLTEITESVANYGCARYANLKAGMAIAKIDPETTPVISSHGEKIFPHIYVVEAEQKSPLKLENTRVGCVYTPGQGQRSPKKLAAALIPINWPTEQYQSETEQGKNVSLGKLANPIILGLSTIFAALGIAIASWLNLGLKVQRTHTVYLVALILGMVQLGTTQLMPANFFGLLGSIIFPILAILMASLFLPDFQLNGQRGYGYIAISILAILVIEFLLYSLCLEVITSLI
jgi:hypothetical protein